MINGRVLSCSATVVRCVTRPCCLLVCRSSFTVGSAVVFRGDSTPGTQLEMIEGFWNEKPRVYHSLLLIESSSISATVCSDSIVVLGATTLELGNFHTHTMHTPVLYQSLSRASSLTKKGSRISLISAVKYEVVTKEVIKRGNIASTCTL